MADFNPAELEDENQYELQNEYHYLDFSDSDEDERVPVFALKGKEEGFNKVCLVDADFIKDTKKDDDGNERKVEYVRLTFQDDEGRERQFNIMNPYKGKDAETVKNSQNQWKHLFGALIASPMVEILNKKKRKVKVKKFFHDEIKIDVKNEKVSPFEQLFNQTKAKFIPNWQKEKLTIVFYFYKNNCSIPLFPPFVSSAYNTTKVEDLVWNSERFSLVATGKSEKKKKDGADTPDSEDADMDAEI